jgi:hypothetical protein
MTTTLDVISRSLRLLGVYAPGDAIPAVEAQDALSVLNRLVTDWRLEELMVYSIDRDVFTATANVQTFTIGPTGDWVRARPLRIDQANWQYQGTQINIPMDPLNDQEYQSLVVRNVQGAIAIKYYYNSTYPDGEIFLWPKPTTTGEVVIFAQHAWTGDATLTTVIALPPGYQAAMEYCLAVELYPEYPRPTGINPLIVQMAEQTKARIKAINEEPPLMVSDAYFLGNGLQKRSGMYTAWAQWQAGDDGT